MGYTGRYIHTGRALVEQQSTYIVVYILRDGSSSDDIGCDAISLVEQTIFCSPLLEQQECCHAQFP